MHTGTEWQVYYISGLRCFDRAMCEQFSQHLPALCVTWVRTNCTCVLKREAYLRSTLSSVHIVNNIT